MTNVLYKIDNIYETFTKSEKKIADFILNEPHRIINMSVQDLSNEINTSTASIVRFSKKITEKGFQELKITISRYLPIDAINNNHMELIDNESVDIIKSKMLARATDTMSCVASQIEQHHIDDICDTLKHARTIFLFGYGASLVIVTDLYQKLSRIGLNVRLIQETHLLMTTMATHDEQDCIIFVTNQGSHSEMQSMAKVATDYNIPIITISSSNNNPVAKISDYTLIYGQTDENELRMAATTSLFAQLFTVDILYYRFIALNYQRSLDSITQSKMALDNYRKHLSKIQFKH
ncbi:MurR/RpiR family transcriptional regulator [Staphylococcus ureilyticus]|uniref:MurR/RpiR family transcriptional regulator n=1 Tax=Staphylococcus ureilyticus TaxID=94138 RepID=UPI000D1C59D4|nr:MurR/RpiR family transcriptional regulator [Staphylococcus ureilyticus]PTF28293.1 MurR/RpiR family transcriptional regulator [Staphylococcus cohnii]UXS59393.1 MurR/RpiR family transcriptional regulator [Staphylococcus ureilyticus]